MDIPMFHFDVRPVPQPYQSPLTQSMAQLVGAGDRYQAQAIQQSAAAKAQGIENIGNNVGSTLMDFAKYQLAQQSPTAQLQRLKVKQELDNMADDDLIQKTVAANGGDVSKALDALKSGTAGGTVPLSAIGKLQTQVIQARKDALDTAHKQLTYKSDVLKQVDQMIPAAPDDPLNPGQYADFQAAYTKALPSIQAVAGPDFSQHLPDPTEPDLVNKLGEIRNWGVTAAQAIAMQRNAIEKQNAANSLAKNTREATEAQTKAAALDLSTATNPAEWAQGIARQKSLGAPDEVLNQFGDFSPAALKRATVLASGKPEAPATGFEDYKNRWATQRGFQPSQISDEQVLQLRKQWTMAGHIQDLRPDDIKPEDLPTIIQTLKDNPSLYGGLTETMRGKLIVPLARAGFTGFGAASPQAIITADARRTRELNKIDSDLGQKLISPDTAATLRNRTEASFNLATQGGKAGAAPFDPNNQKPFFAQPPAPAQPLALNPDLPAPAPGGLPRPAPAPTTAAPVPTVTPTPSAAPDRSTWGPRPDGSSKGMGFLGVFKTPSGQDVSEYSVGVNIGGKEMDVPSLVPTLTSDEVQATLKAANDQKPPPQSVIEKAAAYAKQRIAQGKPVFAQDGEQQLRTDITAPGKQAAPSSATPQSLLKGKAPGHYTLTDGSKWVVNRNGTVAAEP